MVTEINKTSTATRIKYRAETENVPNYLFHMIFGSEIALHYWYHLFTCFVNKSFNQFFFYFSLVIYCAHGRERCN